MCLDYVKKWISISKLKLNPGKTEFITFGPLCPVELVENLDMWMDFDFPCLNMFRMSAKVILCNSVTSDMSGISYS